MIKKKEKTIYIIAVITLIVSIVIGTTYALWQVYFVQEDRNIIIIGEKSNSCVTVVFENPIEDEAAYPKSDADGMKTSPLKFTLKNECDYVAEYEIHLEVLSTTTMNKGIVKAVLDSNTPKLVSEYTSTDSVIENATAHILEADILQINEEKTYYFRKWIDEDATQVEVTDKIFDTKVSIVSSEHTEYIQEFAYTGTVQEFKAKYNGWYWITLIGAKAGWGAFGTITEGKIYLTKGEVLYVYIGEFGSDGDTNLTFNGGGATGPGGVRGGGASDVRLVAGSNIYDWSNFDSLKSRIMVAAGAGGLDGDPTYIGHGGGIYGTKSINNTYYSESEPSSTEYQYYGEYPTQKKGGNVPTFSQWWTPTSLNAGFGYGSSDLDGEAWDWTDYGPGGGGGYYGGGSTSKSGVGGGGSSFISGYAGMNAISSNSTSSNIAHTNNTNHYSNKFFLGGVMHFGIDKGLTNGSGTIKYVGSELYTWKNEVEELRYIRSCMSGNSVDNFAKWSEIQVIKDGVNVAKGLNVTASFPSSSDSLLTLTNLTDGDIDTSGGAYGTYTGEQCITLDLGEVIKPDQVGYFGYFLDGRKSYNNVFSRSTDGSTWVEMHNVSSYTETPEGSHYGDW